MTLAERLNQAAGKVAHYALHQAGITEASLPLRYPDTIEPVPPIRLPAPSHKPAPVSMDALDAGLAEALDFDSLGGLPLTFENVENVLSEEVRPALNNDGGDIQLIEIRGNDIVVKLIGACTTCPSSAVTMRMGVERLLQEQFPTMGDLLDVADVDEH